MLRRKPTTRHQPPCPSCGPLGSRQGWGERIGDPDVPPPPEFARLRRAGESPEGVYELYRCPDCGALFQLQVHEQDHQGGNSTWDWYTLTPWGSPDDRSVHDAAASGDIAGLARRLQSADQGTCLTMLRSLRPLVRGGLDVRALEPSLRQLLPATPELAKNAADVLASFLLKADRGPDVDDLLASSRSETVWGVLDAFWWAGTPGTKIELHARVPNVLRLLESDDETTREKAATALYTPRWFENVDATTVAALTHLLDDDRKDLRDHAASLLERIAAAGHNIRSAIPKLKKRAAKGSSAAKRAVTEAAVTAADKGKIGPLLDALRADPGEMDLVRMLYRCQERGMNISAAFETLGASLTSDRSDAQYWACSALKAAVEKGLDVSPAVPGLRHFIEEERAGGDSTVVSGVVVRGIQGCNAAEILARHLAQQKEWVGLETLLLSLLPEWSPRVAIELRQAVASGMASTKALLLAARQREGPSVTEWSAGNRHIKVGDREVVLSDDSRGGAGLTFPFDEFLGESAVARMRCLTVYDIFGPQVLAEFVEAVRLRQEKQMPAE